MLVRIALRGGMAYQAFVEIVRREYVDVAEREFGIEGRRTTTLRIATLTGLHRKEVARLRSEPRDPEHWQISSRNRAARVMSAWQADARFVDDAGAPRTLSQDEFSDLVRQHSGDMLPRAIADELERAGAVERLADGSVRPTTRGYVPAAGRHLAILEILGADGAEFLETIDHNLTRNDSDPEMLQMKVLYDAVPAEHVQAFRALSHAKAWELLLELDAWLSARDVDVGDAAKAYPDEDPNTDGRESVTDDATVESAEPEDEVARPGAERVALGLGVYQIIRFPSGTIAGQDDGDEQR